MKKRLIIYLLVAIFSIFPSWSFEKDITVKDLFTNFFIDEDKLENLVTLRFGYGIVNTNPNFVINEKIARSYNAQIDYGFSRIKEFHKYPSIFAHSSEFAFIGNISSHLKPTHLPKDGLTIDVWRFGFGIKNGMGYNLQNGRKIFLNHLGAISWTRTDFEQLSQITDNADIQIVFDEKMKFGTVYAGGFDYQLFSFMNLSFEYEHSLVFKNYSAGSLFGAWMTDNVLQRWIDFLDPILIKEYRETYPVFKWLYKNAISVLLNEIRSTRGNFPFGNEPPLNYRSTVLKITLLL